MALYITRDQFLSWARGQGIDTDRCKSISIEVASMYRNPPYVMMKVEQRALDPDGKLFIGPFDDIAMEEIYLPLQFLPEEPHDVGYQDQDVQSS